MRVLLMADSFGATGGGEIMVAYLARQLRQQHEVAILTAGSEPSARRTWEGLTVYHVGARYPAHLRPIRSIMNPPVASGVRDALREFRPDVVHAWNIHHYLGYDALRQARGAGASVIHTSQDAMAFCYTKFHCWIDPTDPRASEASPRARPHTCRNCRPHFWLFPPRNRLIRFYLNRFVSVHAVVSQALDTALRINGLPESRVVHNGIPANDFNVDRAAADATRTGLGLPSGPIVLAGGRLGHFKGHQRALEAFKHALDDSQPATLVMMGGKSWYSDHLAAEAQKLGIGYHVRFPGLLSRTTIPSILNLSSAVLNLSMYMDPFPTMNLESMAARRPVIGTCFGGTPEAVEDGVTGFIVNPYDTEAIAGHVRVLLENRSLVESLGSAGRRRLEERFTIERMTAHYLELYEESRTATGVRSLAESTARSD